MLQVLLDTKIKKSTKECDWIPQHTTQKSWEWADFTLMTLGAAVKYEARGTKKGNVTNMGLYSRGAVHLCVFMSFILSFISGMVSVAVI